MSIDYKHNYGIPTGTARFGRDQMYKWYIIKDYEDGSPGDSWGYEGLRYRATAASGRGEGFATIEEARAYILQQVQASLAGELKYVRDWAEALEGALENLGDDPANLERYAKERDWSPAKANGRSSY